MTELRSVINTLDKAADSFDKIANAEQKKIYDEVITLAKDLDLDAQGKVKQSIANLKRLTEIKARLAALSKDKEWVAGISGFAKYFGVLQQQQNAYYTDHFPSLTLSKSAKQKHALMKQLAVQNTMEALMGSGLKANVTDKLNDILLRAVTTNAKFADLQEELRAHLLGKDGGQGAFSRYATTYATTALSQFTGQNNKLLTDDLDCEWFMYTGSNKETTREFCEKLTEKKYIHRSEIPTILTGRIDDHQCAIYEKTGLPYGMIEGTTADNFQCNCGGWNCRHQLVPVADAVVPASLRAKFAKGKQPEEPLWDTLYKKQKGMFDSIIKWATIFGIDTKPAYNKDIKNEKEFNDNLTRINKATSKRVREYGKIYESAISLADQARSIGSDILSGETYSILPSFAVDKLQTNAQYESNKSELKSLIQKIRNGLNKLTNSNVPQSLQPHAEYWQGRNVKLNEELFSYAEKEIKIVIENKEGRSYCRGNEVHLFMGQRNKDSAWHQESVVYHECGHAIANQRAIYDSKELKDMMSRQKDRLKEKVTVTTEKQVLDIDTGKVVTITETHRTARYKSLDKQLKELNNKISYTKPEECLAKYGVEKDDAIEQLAAVADTLKSLYPKCGWGHTEKYFRQPTNREHEYMAHAFENTLKGNVLFKKLMPDIYQEMIDFIHTLTIPK